MNTYSTNIPCSSIDFNTLRMRASETCKDKRSLIQIDFKSKNQTNNFSEFSSHKNDKVNSINQNERVHVIPVPQIKHVTRTVLIPKVVSRNTEKYTYPIPSCGTISSKKMCFAKGSSILADNRIARAVSPPVDVASKVIFPRKMNKDKVYCEKRLKFINPLKLFHKVKHPAKLKNPHKLNGLTRTQSQHISMTPCPTTFCSYPSKVTNLSFPKQGSTANRVRHINVDISSHPLYVPFQPKNPINVIDLRSCTTKIVDKPCDKFTGQTFCISYPQVDLVCSSEPDGTNKPINSQDSVKNTLFEKIQHSINYNVFPEIIKNNIKSYAQGKTVKDSNLASNTIQKNVKGATRDSNLNNILQHEGISTCVSELTCLSKKNSPVENLLVENVTTPPLDSSSLENVYLKTKIDSSEGTTEKNKPSKNITESLRVEFHHNVGFSSRTPNYLWEVANQLLKKKNFN